MDAQLGREAQVWLSQRIRDRPLVPADAARCGANDGWQ